MMDRHGLITNSLLLTCYVVVLLGVLGMVSSAVPVVRDALVAIFRKH